MCRAPVQSVQISTSLDPERSPGNIRVSDAVYSTERSRRPDACAAVCRALIRIASWIVPSRGRSAWLACRAAELFDWWYLVERGEVLRDSGAALCRRAFAGAFSERFGDSDPRRFVRSPMFVPIAAAASLVALALFSHGFSVTRKCSPSPSTCRNHPLTGNTTSAATASSFTWLPFCSPCDRTRRARPGLAHAARPGVALLGLSRLEGAGGRDLLPLRGSKLGPRSAVC